jgi:hypothetical protein
MKSWAESGRIGPPTPTLSLHRVLDARRVGSESAANVWSRLGMYIGYDLYNDTTRIGVKRRRRKMHSANCCGLLHRLHFAVPRSRGGCIGRLQEELVLTRRGVPSKKTPLRLGVERNLPKIVQPNAVWCSSNCSRSKTRRIASRNQIPIEFLRGCGVSEDPVALTPSPIESKQRHQPSLSDQFAHTQLSLFDR